MQGACPSRCPDSSRCRKATPEKSRWKKFYHSRGCGRYKFPASDLTWSLELPGSSEGEPSVIAWLGPQWLWQAGLAPSGQLSCDPAGAVILRLDEAGRGTGSESIRAVAMQEGPALWDPSREAEEGWGMKSLPFILTTVKGAAGSRLSAPVSRE